MITQIGYDTITAQLLTAGVKPGSKPLQRLLQHAMQSLRGGPCPECGNQGDHETNGTYWQCANHDCAVTWEDGENAPSVAELLKIIFEGEKAPRLVTEWLPKQTT